jgi:predicted nucleotidyltransferase
MRLTELQQLAPQLHELLARHGASNPAVFGSVARDQALPGSDVDLLVDLPGPGWASPGFQDKSIGVTP